MHEHLFSDVRIRDPHVIHGHINQPGPAAGGNNEHREAVCCSAPEQSGILTVCCKIAAVSLLVPYALLPLPGFSLFHAAQSSVLPCDLPVPLAEVPASRGDR